MATAAQRYPRAQRQAGTVSHGATADFHSPTGPLAAPCGHERSFRLMRGLRSKGLPGNLPVRQSGRRSLSRRACLTSSTETLLRLDR